MDNLGFSVFGRPSGLDHVSNGLAEKLNIGKSTYIRFENYKFSIGDSFAEISREITVEGEVIKVLVYQYAESFDKRSGGFVGSGMVFNGEPTKKLLFSALKANHRTALELIDSTTNRFKTQGFDKAQLSKKLVNPKSEDLIKPSIVSRKTADSVKDEYALKIEGSLFNHLMSAVQGFMMNPSFSSVKKLYVSSNTELLADRVGQRKVLSFAHLLDFSKYFSSYNDHLKKIETRYKNLEAQAKAKLDEEKNIEDRTRRTKEEKDRLISQIESKNREFAEIKLKLNQDEQKSKQLSDEINKKRNEYSKVQSQIKDLVRQEFKTATSKEPFKSHYEKVKRSYNDEIDNLNAEINELKEGNKVSKKGVFIISGIGLGLVLIGLFIGSFFLSNLSNGDSTKTIANEESQPQEEVVEPAQPKLKTFTAPKEYTHSEFLQLKEEEIEKHKTSLDNFLKEIEKADTSTYDLSNFFDREWNFGEVIDYNEKSIDQGLTRLKRIKKIYQNHGQTKKLFTQNYMISNFDEYSMQKNDFESTKRNLIIKKYLDKPNNIYSDLEINIENVSNFEQEMPLLYMHFRWIVFDQSEYIDSEGNITSNGDILKTNKTQHNVPLK